jgi:preprotein translocase subunit SecG
MPLLAAWVYSAFLGLFITLFILISVLLVMIILIQKGRGGGLASAFGGGGGNTAFGSKTGDVLTWATSIIFGVFLLIAVILNLMTRPTTRPAVATGGGSGSPTEQTSPAAPSTPAPSTPAPTTNPGLTTIPPIGATGNVPAPILPRSTTQPSSTTQPR